MHDHKPFSLADFQRANGNKKLSEMDYVQAVYATTSLHFDFLISYARLFSPEIKVVDGRAFILELFDSERHQELMAATQDADHAQYWMNLLEITGLFDELTTEQATELAKIIAACWNRTLLAGHESSCGEARYIADPDSGEVFITITKQSL